MASRRRIATSRPWATRVGCREGADRRPVQLGAATGEQREEAVAQQAGDRKRYLDLLSRGQHQPDVLQPEMRRETGRLELVAREQPAVGLVDRASNNVDVRMSR